MSLIESPPRITVPPAIAGNLLSAPRESVARHLLSGGLAGVERRREKIGQTIETLCTAAGVPRRSYLRWRQTNSAPSRPVLQRLTAALDRLELGGGSGERGDDRLIAATLGGFKAQAAAALPAHLNRETLIGHVAIYCANQFAGVRQARLAAHLGLTRAAICQAIRRIEELRDDAGFDAAIRTITRTIIDEED